MDPLHKSLNFIDVSELILRLIASVDGVGVGVVGVGVDVDVGVGDDVGDGSVGAYSFVHYSWSMEISPLQMFRYEN